jgi:hydroxyethylthiazole kinase
MNGKSSGGYGDIAARLLSLVREKSPLIHHITNYVVMNDTANLTLAAGALPVMAHAREEVAEMVGAAGALVLNPGTLSPDWIEAMLIAGRRANELGIPVIYDPVGVGATAYRNECGKLFLESLRLAVIRGNSGEIGSLAGAGGLVRGVESIEGVQDPLGVAKALARRAGCVVAITGKRDIVSDGERSLGVDNGHAMMKTVTGTGCMSTTMTAVFNAVEGDRLIATACALACYGIAGELAARRSRGPGSFRAALLDAFYNLTEARVRSSARIVEL